MNELFEAIAIQLGEILGGKYVVRYEACNTLHGIWWGNGHNMIVDTKVLSQGKVYKCKGHGRGICCCVLSIMDNGQLNIYDRTEKFICSFEVADPKDFDVKTVVDSIKATVMFGLLSSHTEIMQFGKNKNYYPR